MKILEVNKFYYPRRGAERHFLDVISLFEDNGHEVAVFAMDHPENLATKWQRYFPSYVGYNRNDSTVWQRIMGIGRLFWSFEARRKMERLLADFDPDVVHIHNVYHQLSPSIFGPIHRRGIPILMTVHDYHIVSPDKDAYYPHIGRQYWKFLFEKKYGLVKRLLLVGRMYWQEVFDFYRKNVDWFIVPSDFLKRKLIVAGIPKDKLVVIPHFISDDFIEMMVAAEASLLEAGDKGSDLFSLKKIALSFGAVTEEKGIGALAHIAREAGMTLRLIGMKSPEYAVPEGVEWLSPMSREQLVGEILRADCVVSGSRLPETFGLLALEAIACGKPFFGFSVGAYPEIIRDGKDGFLAKSETIFIEKLRAFARGEFLFDSKEIQISAQERFGAARYAESFFRLIPPPK